MPIIPIPTERRFQRLPPLDRIQQLFPGSGASLQWGQLPIGHLPQRGPGPDEVQDEGVSVLLHLLWYVPVHHYLPQRVPPGPDVVHEDLVRGHLELDGRSTVIDLLEFHPHAEFSDHLDPESSLGEFICNRISWDLY